MYGSNRLALGVLLVWVAGFLLFFAFHPGGVMIHDDSLENKDGTKGGDRAVKNPAEILGYLMTHRPGS